jgi:predicted alpha/beta hydrolase
MTTTASRPVVTRNGNAIQASFFHPEGDARAAVLIVPAMGVSQNFYGPLAAWLARQGYLAATFDYGGLGRSSVSDLARLDVHILVWARFDCHALLAELQVLAPVKDLYWIGHSLGWQILGLTPNPARLAKAITVACGSGYWKDNVPQLRLRVWWLWYFVVPVVTRVCGYFPGKRLRKVGDLPRGVIDQWRRWCLNPDYAVGVEGPLAREGFASVRLPITSLSFTDDEMMSARNIQSLHGQYTAAHKKMTRIAPADAGLKRIGHFGFFRAQSEDALWKRYLLPELS